MSQNKGIMKSPLRLAGLVFMLLGFFVFVVGSGPLLGTIAAAKLGLLSDPNPNPVFFGILCYYTFWPGIGMVITGFTVVLLTRRKVANQV